LPCGALGGPEEQIAKLEALHRIEQRSFRLRPGLHVLGLAEERFSLVLVACLVQSVGIG
jgi:hypothetical protein